MERNRDAGKGWCAYVDVLKFAQANPQRWAKIYREGRPARTGGRRGASGTPKLDATLPLGPSAPVQVPLDNGVIAATSRASSRSLQLRLPEPGTGKTPAELGLNQ